MMAVKSLTSRDEWIRGDTQVIEAVFIDSQGNPIDLTGGTVSFTLNDAANPLDDDDAVVEKDITVFNAPTSGIQNITINTDDTNELPIGKYYYDIQFLSAGGAVNSLPRERIKLVPDTTRRND